VGRFGRPTGVGLGGRLDSGFGVSDPVAGVATTEVGGGGAFGTGFGFGLYRLSISSLTAFWALNPLPSNTTLIFSSPCILIR